jgi:hypothetical protein
MYWSWCNTNPFCKMLNLKLSKNAVASLKFYPVGCTVITDLVSKLVLLQLNNYEHGETTHVKALQGLERVHFRARHFSTCTSMFKEFFQLSIRSSKHFLPSSTVLHTHKFVKVILKCTPTACGVFAQSKNWGDRETVRMQQYRNCHDSRCDA